MIQPGQRVLRMAILQGAKVIEERVLRRRETVTIGSAPPPRNTFVVPASNLPASFPIFELRGTQYFLHFTDGMDGKVSTGAAEIDFAGLKAQGIAKKSSAGDYAVPLSDQSKGKVRLGEVTLLFQFVAPPPEVPKAVLPPTAKGSVFAMVDKTFTTILVLSLFTHFSCIFAVSQREARPQDEITLEELPDRFVKMIVPEKPPEPPKTAQQAGADDAKKNDKPKSNKGKDTGPKDAAQRKAEIAKGVAQKGLLKLIGAEGEGSGAIEDVLGAGGKSLGVAEALAGAGGVQAATGDMLAQAGRRGGGSGSAAGIGDLATSGGGNVNLGEGSVGRAHISGRVMDQGPEVESGSCDRESIARFVKLRIRAIQGCYERELKRNTSLRGKVTVRFTIGDSGKVSDVEIEENTIGNDAVVSCIKTTVRLWVFPIKGNECPVAYPFLFAPAG
jgi:hypothetical protein